MNGHQRIEELRRGGVKPTVVWVNDMAGYRPDSEDRALAISVDGDTPEAVDFRCLEGVGIVVLESASQPRLERFIPILLQHVDRVIATQWSIGNDAKIQKITDTGDILTWPNS